MTNSNREQISKLRNTLDAIQENAEFDRQIIATGIFEAWNMLNEDSSLMSIMGQDTQGRNLAKYLHRFHKISDNANFEEHPLKIRPEGGAQAGKLIGNRIMLKAKKEFADNILLVKAQQGWAFIKVVAEEQYANATTKVKKGDPENTSQNYEFYLSVGNQVLDDKQVDAAIAQLEKNRTNRGSNIQQTPDYYRRNTTRGGLHFHHEPEMNAFDRIRELIGDVTALWTATERENFKDTPGGQYQAMAMKNLGIEEVPGVVLSPDKRNAIAQEVARLRTKFDVGQGRGRPGAGRPKGASIEAGKIASREMNRKVGDPVTIITKRLTRLLPTILTQLRIAKRRLNPSDPAIEKIGDVIAQSQNGGDTSFLKGAVTTVGAQLGADVLEKAATGDTEALQQVLAGVRKALLNNRWD